MNKAAYLVATLALSSLVPISKVNAMIANSQPAAPPAAPSAAFEPARVVAEVRRLIREEYVLPERRPALDSVLAEGLSSGRYKVREPALFAERVNSDLARVGRDHHLNFRYDPQRVAAFTAMTPDKEPDLSAMKERARLGNHGVRELRVLPGNVRYLELSGFDWIGDESAAVLSSAMTFLKNGDAVIIDVRRNGGGAGPAVHHVVGHFLDADKPLITFYKGSEASPTFKSPGGLSTMVGKPLYVLTSRGTGSAAEELVGHVAGYKLGEVVGAPTSGAAFMNAVFPVDGRFELSVSVARPVLAATGKDWEGTGIAPTMEAPVEAALETAHVHAIRKLAAAADGPRRARLEGLAEGLEAVGSARAAGAPLETYAGTYGGDRRIAVEGGKLWYRQEERMRRLMVPLGGHRFALADDPSLRIDFQVAGGRAGSFDLGPSGGPVQGRYERRQ